MSAYEQLRPLLADSALITKSPFSPDSSERYRPGLRYAPRCAEHIDADRAGFTLLMPLLIARGGHNVYARDLGARDSLLLSEYPKRPVYLLRPPTAECRRRSTLLSAVARLAAQRMESESGEVGLPPPY